MDLKELRKIVELMNEHGLTYFDMTEGDFHLKLKKGPDLDTIKTILSALPAQQQAPMSAPAPAPAQPTPVDGVAAAPVADGEPVLSPMVGTFYRCSSPDAPPFVEVGDTVKEGQTLCIIEAMKVMNEIKAERGGTITEVHAEDSTPVQFGDALFQIK